MGTYQAAAKSIRTSCACITFLFLISPVSANGKENTHPAKPAELLAAIGNADKIIVYYGGPVMYVGQGKKAPTPLYSSVDLKDISELKQAFAFEPPKSWFRCACIPSLDITLSRKGEEIGVISIYEDLTVGFSRWSGDVQLVDREKLLKWFDARGISSPRRALEEQQERDRADGIAADRWLAAMPSDLRALWPQVLKDPQWWSNPQEAPKEGARVLEPVLANEYPNINQRIRSLFVWFGSGSGPWSGYYAWEDVASQMLLQYSPSELVTALQGRPLTEQEIEGAARFFAGYAPGVLFRPDGDNVLIQHLPDELKKTFLEHVEKSGSEDKIERARKAFLKP